MVPYQKKGPFPEGPFSFAETHILFKKRYMLYIGIFMIIF